MNQVTRLRQTLQLEVCSSSVIPPAGTHVKSIHHALVENGSDLSKEQLILSAMGKTSNSHVVSPIFDYQLLGSSRGKSGTMLLRNSQRHSTWLEEKMRDEVCG